MNAPWGEEGLTACQMACELDGLSVGPTILKLLSEADGFDANEVWASNGATHLQVVGSNGWEEGVKIILAAGADPTKPGTHGRTPLRIACQQGHLGVARLLLAAGAMMEVDWIVKDEGVMTVLAWSCMTGLVDVVREEIARGESDTEAQVEGHTALHLACRYGFAEVAKVLIAGGANIEAEAADGTTRLVFACRGGFDASVKVLLEARAEVDMAMERGGSWPLGVASQYGHLKAAQELIAWGADVGKYSPICNTTPLKLAAMFGHMRVVKELIRRGATAELIQAGANPEERFLLLVQVLLEEVPVSADNVTPRNLEALKGAAKVDAASDDGSFLLQIACEKGFVGAVKMLIERGADVNKMFEGSTPLEVGCKGGSVEIVRELIKGGAASTVALCEAAKYQEVEVVWPSPGTKSQASRP